MPTTRATGQPATVPLPLAAGEARQALKALLTGTRWCRQSDSVVLAVHEALTNAERHGGGALRVYAWVDQGVLVVAVCDRGPGFRLPPAACESVPGADPFAEHGRGLCLMAQIASRVEAGTDDGDFCLRLRFDPP
jgi:anti-sigma regulatory factor (Ser/Thr protein kinase)